MPPHPYLIHHLLEASARADPDAPAVIDGERTISYGELDRRANQLARSLVQLGVHPGDRVALYLDKSLESVLAIYGALKAGAAYVPLDPQAPPARLAYITADATPRVLITQTAKAEACVEVVSRTTSAIAQVVLDDPSTFDGLARLDDSDPGVRRIEDDLAYVLYTSGSTGMPKGVMLSHRNCLAFVGWAAGEFRLSAADRVSSHAPFHFDLSTFDLYGAAFAGAAVVLVPGQASVFPTQIRQFIEDQRITIWYSVPSILTMLSLRGGLGPGSLTSLRTVLFAGEVFPTPHLRRLLDALPHVRFANLYGPTETNVCTWYDVIRPLPDGDEPIPIGRAIDNVEVFGVTDDGRRVGVGEVGELLVRGPTVMQGYLGDSERTATRLITDPFSESVQRTVYRTGDLVELTGSGDYRFLGRRDEQIKSRGYRIELGDVEAALYAHPAVTECAVVPVADEIVTNRLLAFVTTRAPLTDAELVGFSAERLPHYMIPERIEFTDELPRTSTGKVDRRALADRAAAR